MGTRSTIWIKNEDGTFKGIYCHWDGYPDGVGKTLFYNYIDKEKINNLIKLGSISSLHESIECPKGHSFATPVEGYTIAYHRDRGERLHIYTAENLGDAIYSGDNDYQYFFIDGKWKICRCTDIESLHELTEKDFE